MALSNATQDRIKIRLRPCSALEFINACNSLNATLSKDTRLQLQSRMLRPAVLSMVDLLALASKGTVFSSTGQDALLLKNLNQWLNSDEASRDVMNNIATVT